MSVYPPQAYRTTAGIHRLGAAANRPAAADVLPGTLYFSADTGVLERSDGVGWAAYAGSGGGGGGTGNVTGPGSATDSAIALYDGPSGTLLKDSGVLVSALAPLASPALTGVPTVPTAGAGTNTTQAASTAFVTDAVATGRATPVLHRVSHETGGSDALTALDASILTSGTLPDARLSTNVQMKPVAESDVTNLVTDLAAKVAGPASALNNGVALFSGTTGKIVKDSAVQMANVAVKNVANTFTAANDFTGATITAPTQTAGDTSTKVATTAFVTSAVSTGTATPAAHHVSHETGGSDALAALSASILTSGTLPDARLSSNVQMKPVAESDVTNLVTDLAAKAPLASPALTGTPTVPTATAGTNTTQAASTAFVTAAVTASNAVAPAAHHASHESGGTDAVTLAQSQVTNLVTDLAAKAPLASPAFTGTPTTTSLAASGIVTANRVGVADGTFGTPAVYPTGRTDFGIQFDTSAGRRKVIIGGPTFEEFSVDCNSHAINQSSVVMSGLVLQPTTMGAAVSLQISSTSSTPGIAFGGNSNLFPGIKRSGTVTTGMEVRLADDSDWAPLSAKTAAAATNSTQVATTAFVQGEIAAKAPLASPALTGTPTVPTAAAGTNTTQAASTAFVQTAISPAVNIWAPVDGSGASLTLTVNSARVAVLGPFVFFMFDVTYPTTASGANALVGGLPSMANGQGYAAVFYSDAPTADHALINNGTTNMFVMTAGHATLTNANLSGKTLRVSGWYFR